MEFRWVGRTGPREEKSRYGIATASRNTKTCMMNRKEPKQCGKWEGEVERIQIMDNLKCQEEFTFDPINSSLLPTKHFPDKFYIPGTVKQIQINNVQEAHNLVGMTDK